MLYSARRFWPWLLVLGLATFAIVLPTAIGWTYDQAPELGAPLWSSRFLTIYGPDAAARWWWNWSSDPAFRAVAWQATGTASWVTFATVLGGSYACYIRSPLPPVQPEDDAPARYGHLDDLLALGRVTMDQRGVVIGREGKRPVYHVGDDHLLLVGASRVGDKGTSFVMPTLADIPDALIVFDPKGELFQATADERAKLGPVFMFDPTRAGSAKFNPLQEIRGGDMSITDAESIGELLTYGMDHGADPFWRTQAAMLLAGLVREACLSQTRPTFDRVREVFIGLRSNRCPSMSDRFVRERIDGFMRLEERPRSGVQAQVDLALRFTATPATMAKLARSDFTASDICCGEKPATIYLTFPAAEIAVHTQVIRMVLQALFKSLMTDRAACGDGRVKQHRVTWVLDEFPTLGHLPFIETAMAVAAGYGNKMFLVAQDIAQIQSSYGRDEAITRNCGHMVFASLSDTGLAFATKVAGTVVAPMRARHRRIGVLDRQSETASQSRQPMISGSEARSMTVDHALVIPAVGGKPVWLSKARYWQMACYRGRIRDSRV